MYQIINLEQERFILVHVSKFSVDSHLTLSLGPMAAQYIMGRYIVEEASSPRGVWEAEREKKV
jgi:hypothetical protein